MSQHTSGTVAEAVEAFQNGDPVLIHDFEDREGETDVVYPAGATTPEAVARMRNDAGGLICVAVSDEVARTFDLPFLDDVIDHPTASDQDLAYDDRSAFSYPVNHRDTYTGITDRDRSLTIRNLGEAAANAVEGGYDADDFGSEFRSPGHVYVLRGAPGLLEERRGHTELSLALAAEADLPPAVVVCEMLDDETGQALPKVNARNYAERHDLVFLEGAEIVEQLG